MENHYLIKQQFYRTISITIIFSLTFTNLSVCDASNILFFHLAPSTSHRTSIWPLASTLADRGHNITYIFPLPPEHRLSLTHPKIREIVPSKLLPIATEYLTDFDINLRLNGTVNQFFWKMFQNSVNFCQAFYESPEIQKLLDPSYPNSFDLVFIDGGFGECVYPLVWRFRPTKHILFYPSPTPGWIYDAHGFLPESGAVPEVAFYSKPDEMQYFWHRVKSALSPFLCRIGQLEYIRRLGHLREFEGIPDVLEFEANTSLVFVNSGFIEDYPIALPPMIQSYSGLGCFGKKEEKSIPSEIRAFVEGPEVEGFIYVSFGSSVNPSSMPGYLKKIFFKAFAQFPKYRFLWRWGKARIKGLEVPKNVMLRPWFPQKELLGHENIKAFITQAGRPSTQEALCWGVPMIAIPVMADQDYNAVRLEAIGAAVKLNFKDLTSENLKNVLRAVVGMDGEGEGEFQRNLKVLREKFMDRVVNPLDNAVYWTEYVLRYKDTDHLKPLGRNRYWWERRQLDVYLFFGVIVLGIWMFLWWKLIKFVRWLFCKKKKESLKNVKKD